MCIMCIYNKPTDKTIFPIYVDQSTTFLNKYTILSWKKSMCHCRKWKCKRKTVQKTEKKTMQEQKYPMSLIEAIILRATKYLLKF